MERNAETPVVELTSDTLGITSFEVGATVSKFVPLEICSCQAIANFLRRRRASNFSQNTKKVRTKMNKIETKKSKGYSKKVVVHQMGMLLQSDAVICDGDSYKQMNTRVTKIRSEKKKVYLREEVNLLESG